MLADIADISRVAGPSMPRTPRRPSPAAPNAAFDPVEAGAAIGIGVLALLTSGAIGLLLPALVDEGRLSASGIGLTAMLEALSTGLVTGGAGMVLKPARLRITAAIATVVLVGLDLATVRASGQSVMLVRALAGMPEGILLWIAIGFIARTATPERWAAVLFTGMGVTQVALATLLTAWVLPHHGANGGYMALGASAALAIFLAPFLPASLGPVTTDQASSGAPPPRGWVALAATLFMAASLTAIAVYVVPLARQAGLGAAAGRSAVSVQLGCNLAGGVLATAIAGRVRYLTVFWCCAAVFMATWAVYAMQAPAWLFVAMSGLAGVAAKLEDLPNIAVVRLADRDIVRHPLVAEMLSVL